MKRYSEGTTHVVLYSYAIGFCLIFVGLVATGDLLTSAIFAAKVRFLSARLVFFLLDQLDRLVFLFIFPFFCIFLYGAMIDLAYLSIISLLSAASLGSVRPRLHAVPCWLLRRAGEAPERGLFNFQLQRQRQLYALLALFQLLFFLLKRRIIQNANLFVHYLLGF